MKIIIDQNTCIGCSPCVLLCETIFAIDGNELATIITSEYSIQVINDLLEATNYCLVNAIFVEE